MRRAVVLSTLTAATLALGTLTACGSDDPAPNYSSVSPTPTAPSTSASPTPTARNTRPGETSPAPFPEVSQSSTVGALAFAAYYVKTLDWVLATGDVDLLEPFYASNCTTCQNRLKYLRDLFSDGQYISGGRVQLTKQAIVTNDGRLGATYAVSTVMNIEPATVVSGEGSVVTSAPESDGYTLTTWVTRNAAGWLIVEERQA